MLEIPFIKGNEMAWMKCVRFLVKARIFLRRGMETGSTAHKTSTVQYGRFSLPLW